MGKLMQRSKRRALVALVTRRSAAQELRIQSLGTIRLFESMTIPTAPICRHRIMPRSWHAARSCPCLDAGARGPQWAGPPES